jgi:hypothetical protein
MIMTALQLYEDETERTQHIRVIKMLARDLNRPEDQMGQIYEFELEKLKEDARVKDFLIVLVSRRIREIFKG